MTTKLVVQSTPARAQAGIPTRKISFVRLENTAFGGAEVYLQRVCEVLSRQQIEYEVVYGKIPKFFASWIKALWFSYQVKRNKGHKFYFALARITSPDIYRAGDGVHRAYMEAMGLRFWQNPIHFVSCYLEKQAFLNSKKIIANSAMTKRNILQYYAVPEDKIVVIHNGVNQPEPVDAHLAKARLAAELKFSADKKIILFVGSGFKRKGADVFLKMLAEVQGDFMAILVGKEKKIAAYRRLAENLGLTDKVRFVGQRRDISQFYAASDIFLYPARYEPFGLVVLEAMQSGNAVFASKTCGSSEVLLADYVMDGPADKRALRKIEVLLNDAVALAKIKQRNQDISKAYSIEQNVDKTLTVIRDVLQNHLF